MRLPSRDHEYEFDFQKEGLLQFTGERLILSILVKHPTNSE